MRAPFVKVLEKEPHGLPYYSACAFIRSCTLEMTPSITQAIATKLPAWIVTTKMFSLRSAS